MQGLRTAIDRPLEDWASVHGDSDKITKSYIIPLMENSKRYDRLSGYFSLESLSLISKGLHKLIKSEGQMRLIVGIHDFDLKIKEGYELSNRMLEEELNDYFEKILVDWYSLKDAVIKEDIKVLACLLYKKRLQIKGAIPKKTYHGQSHGIFHYKLLIFSDDENVVTAIGSPNETYRGLKENGEGLDFHRSWEKAESWHTKDHVEDFERLWENNSDMYYIFEIPDIVKEKLIERFYLCDENTKKSACREKITELIGWMEALLKHPDAWPYTLGNIYLFPHQIKNIEQAVNKYPMRLLIADEVGLGKTISAGGIIKHNINQGMVNKFLLLAPANLVFQWQNELKDNFDIDTFAYDSANKCYKTPTGSLISSSNPFKKLPNGNLIVSWHLARNYKKEFYKTSSNYDMLIVDEVHNARLYRDNTKKPNTLLYSLLEDSKLYFRDEVFLTATPVQTDINELLGIIKLLGVGGEYWTDIGNFESFYVTIDNHLSYPDNLKNCIKGIKWFSENYLTDDEFREILSHVRMPFMGQIDTDQIYAIVKRLFDDVDSEEVLRYMLDYDKDIIRLLVLLSPLHNLMFRNTRDSLKAFGYNFPERLFEDILLSQKYDAQALDKIISIRTKINEYFDNNITKTLSYIDNKSIIGFTKCIYHQRFCSSLYSTYKTIQNRKNILQKILMENYNHEKQLAEKLQRELDESWSSTSSVIFEPQNDQMIDDLELYEYDDEYSRDEFKEYIEGDDPTDIKQYRELSGTYNEILKDLLNGNNGLKNSLESEIAAIDNLEKELKQYVINPELDPKIKICMDQLDLLAIEGHKILFFTKYKDTVSAFIQALKNIGHDLSTIAIYSGDGGTIFLNGEEKRVEKSVITRLLDEGSLNAIICTDAASEGLNLQSADIEVHIDVPWNPAKLEQRIGRVDRLGQTRKEVVIKYIWYPDQESIEYRMLKSLVERLGFSKITIGPVQSIISSAFEELISGNSQVGTTIESTIMEINRINESSLRIFSDLRINGEGSYQYKPEIEGLPLKVLIFLSKELGKTLIVNGGRVKLLDMDEHQNSANLTKGMKNYLTLSHPMIKYLFKELKSKYTNNKSSNNRILISSHPIGVYKVERDGGIMEHIPIEDILNNINRLLDDISNSYKEESHEQLST